MARGANQGCGVQPSREIRRQKGGVDSKITGASREDWDRVDASDCEFRGCELGRRVGFSQRCGAGLAWRGPGDNLRGLGGREFAGGRDQGAADVKKDIHPEYREVVFYDHGADFKLLTRSTVKTDQTIEYNGKTYPMVTVPISSASHPFFTGKSVFVDSAGQVEKFQRRFKNWKGAKKS
jgi:large subunit ribosomal protein L31